VGQIRPGRRGPPPSNVQSSGDPRPGSDPQAIAGPAGRVPDEGRPQHGHIRRQGPEPAEPRPQLLAEAVDRAGRPAHSERHRQGRGPRVHDDRLGQRGSASRDQSREAPPAALQTSGSRTTRATRSSRSRARTSPGSSGRASSRPTAAGTSAVRVGQQRGRGDEPDSPPLPVPDVHARDSRGSQGDRATLPPVPHQALPGPIASDTSARPTTGPTSPRSSASSRAGRRSSPVS